MSMSEGGWCRKDKHLRCTGKSEKFGDKGKSFPYFYIRQVEFYDNKIRNQGTSKCPIFNQDFGCQDFMHLTFWKEM